jgi:hypothetical protein
VPDGREEGLKFEPESGRGERQDIVILLLQCCRRRRVVLLLHLGRLRRRLGLLLLCFHGGGVEEIGFELDAAHRSAGEGTPHRVHEVPRLHLL